eukprot:CAMPEP_0168337292 /NCGR_PEP_ID=MMETSP0213-20121227/12080_1 /TAXON_ID=151035 /ORGANISM="Euplotes harpa, Strain FSP1.4" /LENGTH=246 /DNA_ID=CAMNT_0008342707 /DNA_START=264 /DNA_END=1001 /DNA_ORIENTATION=-
MHDFEYRDEDKRYIKLIIDVVDPESDPRYVLKSDSKIRCKKTNTFQVESHEPNTKEGKKEGTKTDKKVVYLNAVIGDDYFSIKNTIDCNVMYHENEDFKEETTRYKEEIKEKVFKTYQETNLKQKDHKKKILKANDEVKKALKKMNGKENLAESQVSMNDVEIAIQDQSYFEEDEESEEMVFTKHNQAELVSKALAHKYADNKGDIKKLVDVIEYFTNTIALDIYPMIKDPLMNSFVYKKNNENSA